MSETTGLRVTATAVVEYTPEELDETGITAEQAKLNLQQLLEEDPSFATYDVEQVTEEEI